MNAPVVDRPQQDVTRTKTRFVWYFVDIREMVWHIYRETKEFFKGTMYEEILFFHHDALTLMRSKETKQWMCEKHGLNSQLKRYDGHPVGNSPELMPLDCSLNKDINSELWRHILYTRNLSDPQKFSLSTPKRGAHAIKRIWQRSLSSKRIMEDGNKVVDEALGRIRASNGTVVPKFGHRNGRRLLEGRAAGLVGKHGGNRVRHVVVTRQRWIHEDAIEARKQLLANSSIAFREVKQPDETDGVEETAEFENEVTEI